MRLQGAPWPSASDAIFCSARISTPRRAVAGRCREDQ